MARKRSSKSRSIDVAHSRIPDLGFSYRKLGRSTSTSGYTKKRRPAKAKRGKKRGSKMVISQALRNSLVNDTLRKVLQQS